RFAGSLKDFAVSVFGTNDKPALIVGIVITTRLLGAVAGLVELRRSWGGAVVVAVFAVVGLLASFADPLGSKALMTFAVLLASTVAAIALHVSVGRIRPSMLIDASPERVPPQDMRIKTPDRRQFLRAAGLIGTAGAATAVAGRGLRSAVGAPSGDNVVLPAPVSTTGTVVAGEPLTVAGISPYVTPTEDFYRIDTALVVPRPDVSKWKLSFKGLVENPYSITYDEILAMDQVEVPVTISCVSNEVGGDLVGNATWSGVPLRLLLDRAGVRPEATQIVGRSIDDFTAGFPTSALADDRTALLAVGMNGAPLTADHGFPARLIIAGLYGYVSATKWLKEIELTTWEQFDGYWIPRGWDKEGPVLTQSRIDVPANGIMKVGPNPIAGVAWAPTRGISKVEVSIDDGPWMEAKLGSVASDETWVQWMYVWDAVQGDHRARVRATDGDGVVQTSVEHRPGPNGATGYHSKKLLVS
ncbi:MAG: molybdopterin-dependent oxidoreductase, partial [Acidimicrobiia bacterium]